MNRSKGIVLVEDDEGHALLFVKQLRRHGLRNPIHHFATGELALAFLDTPVAAVETPLLIVLDINLPDMPGTEVLARISAHPTVKAIPVVMLTSSDDEEDARLSAELGCRHYMIKPLHVQRFVDICSDLGYPLSIDPGVAFDTATTKPMGSPSTDRST